MNFSSPERLRARDPRFWSEPPEPRAEWRRILIGLAIWTPPLALAWGGVAALTYWAFFGGHP